MKSKSIGDLLQEERIFHWYSFSLNTLLILGLFSPESFFVSLLSYCTSHSMYKDVKYILHFLNLNISWKHLADRSRLSLSNWLSVFEHGTTEDKIVGIPKFLSLHVIRCSLQGKLRSPMEISREKTIFSVTHLLLKPGSENSLNFHFLNYRPLLEPRPCVQVTRTRDLSRGKLSYFAHSVCALSRH